jgi:hypothetical protein
MADMDIESDAGSVKRTPASEAFPGIGHKMTFLFDYGDNWEFRVELIGENTRERGGEVSTRDQESRHGAGAVSARGGR